MRCESRKRNAGGQGQNTPVLNPFGEREAAGHRKLPAAAEFYVTRKRKGEGLLTVHGKEELGGANTVNKDINSSEFFQQSLDDITYLVVLHEEE